MNEFPQKRGLVGKRGSRVQSFMSNKDKSSQRITQQLFKDKWARNSGTKVIAVEV